MANPIGVADDFAVFRHSAEMVAGIIGSWKPAKRAAARYLAIGCAQEYAAQHSGVTKRTVQNWCTEPDFDAYVLYLRETALQQVEPAIMANLHLALEVQQQVLRGEIPADDGRYTAADKLIYRFLDKLMAVEAGPATPGPYPPPVAVTVNQITAPAPRSGRILPAELDSPDPAHDSPSG